MTQTNGPGNDYEKYLSFSKSLAFAVCVMSGVGALGGALGSGKAAAFLGNTLAMNLPAAICLALLAAAHLASASGATVKLVTTALSFVAIVIALGSASAMTAGLLCSTGLVLLLRVHFSSRVQIWQSPLLINLACTSLVLFGHVYGINPLAWYYPYSNVTANMALAMAFLNLAQLFSAPTSGFLGAFNSEYAGGKMARKILPFSILALAAFGLVVRLAEHFQFYDKSFDLTFIVTIGSVIITWLVWSRAKETNCLDRSLGRSLAEATKLNDSLKLLIDHAPGAVAMFDTKMRYLWASARWLHDYGLEGENLAGRSLYEVFPQIPEAWKAVHRRCLMGFVERADEEPFTQSSGRTSWIRWEARPWYEGSSIGGMVIFSEDITTRKLALQNLEKLNRELEARVAERTQEVAVQAEIVVNMAEGACLIRAGDGTIAFANPRFSSMFGYAEGELAGKHASILNYGSTTERSNQIAHELMARIRREGSCTYEIQNVRKDGSPFWCRATTSVFEHGQFGTVFVALHEDITEKRAKDQAISASERKFRSLVESAYDAILVTDDKGRIALVNEQLCRYFGYRSEELIGRPMQLLVPERHRSNHALWCERYREHAQPRPMGTVLDLTGRRKDGTEFPVDISLSPTEMPEGLLVTAIIRDVSERKRYEDQQTFLAETVRLLNETIDYDERIQRIAATVVPRIADNCVVWILENNELKAKAAVAADPRKLPLITSHIDKIAGFSGAKGAGEVLRTAKPVFVRNVVRDITENPDADPGLRNLAKETGSTSYIAMPLSVRGNVVGSITLSMSTPGRLFSPADFMFIEVVAARCAVTIENARLYRDAQIATAAAKAAVRIREEVLAVVSHDLKNPLASIDLAASLLENKTLPSERVIDYAERIHRAVKQAVQLISNLLDFAKIQSGTFSVEQVPEKISEVVSPCVESLRTLIEAKKLHLKFNAHAQDFDVFCDSKRTNQVVANLLGNAIKFTPEGGTIEVQYQERGDEVLVSVSDTGLGISRENLSRVFDRYWQAENTKNHGNGLGLAIAKGIIDAHGGRIWAESEPGRGSRFFFTLPKRRPQKAFPSPRTGAGVPARLTAAFRLEEK